MQERKKVVALISIGVFLGRGFLYWIMFGKVIDDPEFDQALVRAEHVGIDGIEVIQEYPFTPITRREAAEWYVLLARDIELVPQQADDCLFDDIETFDLETKDRIELACLYIFFKGTGGSFYPDQYVTKANSLVALMRGLSPGRDFPIEDPYWTPYVTLAYEQGITKRPSGPYLMYLVTKYELLLQLWRVAKTKTS